MWQWVACWLVLCVAMHPAQAQEPPATMPGTSPLTLQGDIASQLVAGVDRFLLDQLQGLRSQADSPLEVERSIGGRL